MISPKKRPCKDCGRLIEYKPRHVRCLKHYLEWLDLKQKQWAERHPNILFESSDEEKDGKDAVEQRTCAGV